MTGMTLLIVKNKQMETEKKEVQNFNLQNFGKQNTPKWAEITGNIALVGALIVGTAGTSGLLAPALAIQIVTMLGAVKAAMKFFGFTEPK